jgi:alpha-1,3-mannosyltransferase
LKKEKDKKILFIGRYNESDIFSGPEKTAKRIYEQASINFNTVFIQYFFDGRKYNYFKKLFGKEDKNDIITFGLFRLFFYLFSFKPDIIHIITFERFAAVAFMYKLFSGVKIIYSSHGIVVYENEIKNSPSFLKLKDKMCEKLYLKFSSKIIFPSEYYAEKTNEFYKFNKNKTIIIPNGIDEIFHKIYENKKYQEGLLRIVIETYKIGVNKKIELVFSILENLKDKIELYLINSENVSYNSDKLKIHSYNKMPLNAFAEFIAGKDVFLSLAEYDTFSISAAEAMAAGLIPIVTKSTGIAEYIDNGSNGFIHNYNNISDILKKLIDIESRKSISAQAASVYSLLNWESVYNKYEFVYNDLI